MFPLILLLLCSCATVERPSPPPDLWPTLKEYTSAQQERAKAEFVELCKMGAISCQLILDYMDLRRKTRECRPAGGL